MKTILCAITVSLCCTFALGQAQYKVLWTFGGGPDDGAVPTSNLIFDRSGNLYGTTEGGGSGRTIGGTVFELSPNGDGTWSETILYNFCSHYVDRKCKDGAAPQAGVILDRHGNLYGTTQFGGTQNCPIATEGCSTVFELLRPPVPGGAWTERVLYNFCMNSVGSQCTDGSAPLGQLAMDVSGNLYGTTSNGGPGHSVGGTVFELSHGANGVTHSIIYSFCSIGQGDVCPDGALPVAGVTFDTSGNLYGTTKAGGSPVNVGAGTLYKLSPGSNGWMETVLIGPGAATKGSAPLGAVTLDKLGNLYSTFSAGGAGNAGGAFRYSLQNGKATTFSFDNTDGAYPSAGVVLDSINGALYGTTRNNALGYGNVYQITASGQESVIYNFCSQNDCTDGETPLGSLIEDSSGNLYGTASLGGTNGNGVVFEITP